MAKRILTAKTPEELVDLLRFKLASFNMDAKNEGLSFGGELLPPAIDIIEANGWAEEVRPIVISFLLKIHKNTIVSMSTDYGFWPSDTGKFMRSWMSYFSRFNWPELEQIGRSMDAIEKSMTKRSP